MIGVRLSYAKHAELSRYVLYVLYVLYVMRCFQLSGKHPGIEDANPDLQCSDRGGHASHGSRWRIQALYREPRATVLVRVACMTVLLDSE